MSAIYTALFANAVLPLMMVFLVVIEKPVLILLEKGLILLALTFLGGAWVLTKIGTFFEWASERIERRLIMRELTGRG